MFQNGNTMSQDRYPAGTARLQPPAILHATPHPNNKRMPTTCPRRRASGAPACWRLRGCWLLLAALLAACGTLQVGIERTPTPDTRPLATITALAQENNRLATAIATLTTPSVSPALGTLAYVQDGDLWVRTLPDGQAQRITTDGRNAEPRWSPSGGWIAFRKDESQVWVVRADGSAARPLSGGGLVGAFAWAPGRDRLAYVAGSTALRLVDADGGRPDTLVPARQAAGGPSEIGRIAWRPDGGQIAFEWRDISETRPLAEQGVWIVSVASFARQEIYRGDAILAGWAGDSRSVLFWQVSTAAATLPDGAPLYAIEPGGPARALAETVLVHPDFVAPAPNAARVALISGRGRAAWTNKALQLTAAGGEPTTVTPPGQAATSPAWAPDGRRVAFASAPDRRLDPESTGDAARRELAQRRIYVAEVAGAPRAAPVTDDPAYRDERPAWSRDGRYLLFARLSGEGRASLWVVGAGGGAPRRVVDDLTPGPDWLGYYGHINWNQLFDWWRGPATPPPAAPNTIIPTPTLEPGAGTPQPGDPS
jgi:Tol biopolymer transport system component